jgi:actin-related protein 6
VGASDAAHHVVENLLILSSGQALNAYNDLHPLFGDPPPPEPTSSLAALPLECLLVIDSGFSQTTVTPIYNGRLLQRAIRRLDFGGKHLTNLLKEVISMKYVDLHENTKIVNDIKEDVCFVSNDFRDDIEKTGRGNRPRRPAKLRPPLSEDPMDLDQEKPASSTFIDYVLPDGVHRLRGDARPHDPFTSASRKRKLNALAPESDEVSMTLGNERFTIPEIIFTPSDIASKQPGIADCVMQSLSVLPPLIQASMLANTLVVGGNTKMPGFVERLQSELRMLARADYAVRVRRMEDPITSTWLGGARMASNREVVREYGITKEEYFEHGSLWAGRKFAGLGK